MSRVDLEKKRQGEGCEIKEEEPKPQEVEGEDEEQLEEKRQGEGCEIAEEPKPQKVEDEAEDPAFYFDDSDEDDADNTLSKAVETGSGNDKFVVLRDETEGYECDKERLCNIHQHDSMFGFVVFDIFKVKLMLNDNYDGKVVSGHLHGQISVARSPGNPNRTTFYFDVGKDRAVPFTLAPGMNIILPLSGPLTGRPPVLLTPEVRVDFVLNFDYRDVLENSRSRAYAKSGHFYMSRALAGHTRKFKILRNLLGYLPSDRFKVALYYGVYVGAWATVYVEMLKKDVSGFYGLIFAHSCVFNSRIRLLSISSFQKQKIQAYEYESARPAHVKLARKVVSVPSYSSLIIGAVLYDQDDNQIVKDRTIFPAKPRGHVEASIGGIKVKVEWGSRPDKADDIFRWCI